MRPRAGVNLTPRPDRSDPGELVVEISIDTSGFESAMRRLAEASAGLAAGMAAAAGPGFRSAVNAAIEAERAAPPLTGLLRRSIQRFAQREQELTHLRCVVRPEDWEAAQVEAARRGAFVGDEVAGIRSLCTDAMAGAWPATDDQVDSARSAFDALAALMESSPLDQCRLRSPDGPLSVAGTAPRSYRYGEDDQAFDLDPDRCWKCDVKPGVEELDGACWRCWYKLTGKAQTPHP